VGGGERNEISFYNSGWDEIRIWDGVINPYPANVENIVNF
jgi:hypothetical protein